MPQHIEIQQTNGETDSEKRAGKSGRSLPHNPTDVSSRASLRRRYKKHFGYKPCGMSEDDMRRAVEAREQKEAERVSPNSDRPSQWNDNY